MKRLFGIATLLLHLQCLANMANPVMEGTLGGSPFVNAYVDISHEDIYIQINEHFELASFKIAYHISSSKEGIQIPFLFYASEYADDFSVKLNGKPLLIQTIPSAYNIPERTKFNDFAYFFEKPAYTDYSQVLLEDAPGSGFQIALKDMIYFEADIPQGTHIIEVSYKANKWTDSWDWIKEYSFRYALSPAKYWKSFGSLSVKIEAHRCDYELSTNLGDPQMGNLNEIAEWEFDHLPAEILKISYVPKISSTAQSLIALQPSGLALITGLFLALIHFYIMLRYRKRFPHKRFSIVLILGSILVPFIFLLSWMYYFDFIDYQIGIHAGRAHGYTFISMVFYPLILAIYGLVFWLIDRRLRIKFS
ncbi:MAG: hypothetical protein AAF487_09450 [Bacteroidota bacterium]